MKNIFGESLTSFGGKKVYCFQSLDSFLAIAGETQRGSFDDFLEFLEIPKELEKTLFLSVFAIKDNKDRSINVFNSYNYHLLSESEGYKKVVYIFHNKKVKAIKVFTGQMEVVLVNKKHIFKLYEIESSF